MRINLLWPRWAELVSTLRVETVQGRGGRCWRTVQRAALLLVNLTHSEQNARREREREPFPSRIPGRYSPGAAARWLMLLVVALGCSLVPSRAAAADKWLVALHAAGAADLVSTEIWLHQGPHAGELNPLAQHLGTRIALKAGYNTLAWWCAKKLEDDGHGRLADVVRYTALSVQLGATGWNVHLTVSR